MSKVMVMDHPLIQHKIGLIRKKETGTKDFRETISEIAMSSPGVRAFRVLSSLSRRPHRFCVRVHAVCGGISAALPYIRAVLHIVLVHDNAGVLLVDRFIVKAALDLCGGDGPQEKLGRFQRHQQAAFRTHPVPLFR